MFLELLELTTSCIITTALHTRPIFENMQAADTKSFISVPF